MLTTGEKPIQASDLAAKRAAKYQGRNRINSGPSACRWRPWPSRVFWLVWILWENPAPGHRWPEHRAAHRNDTRAQRSRRYRHAIWRGSLVMVVLATA